MRHADFRIGAEFRCGGRLWRCTDIGTRTIVAIRIDRFACQDNASFTIPRLRPTLRISYVVCQGKKCLRDRVAVIDRDRLSKKSDRGIQRLA